MNNISRYKRCKTGIIVLSVVMILSACETEEEAAQSHLQRGKELLAKGDYVAAQLELKTAKQGNKSTGETYYYLALLDEKARNYYAMQDNLQKTLDLEPDHQQAHLKLGKLKLLMGEVDKANEHVGSLLAKNPEDVEALVLKSSILLRENKQDNALVIINAILEANPTHVDALTLKSMIFMQQDKKAEALVLIDKAIIADEKNISLHQFKIQIHAKQNAVDEVIKDYLALVALFPKNDSYKITLAKVYAKSGRPEQAETLLRNLVSAQANAIKPKILLLEFLAATASDQVDGQVAEFTTQLEKKPKQLFDFAKWMLAKGNMPRAEALLKKVIAIDESSEIGVEANILLAKLAFDSGDYAQTQKIAAAILVESPNQVEAKLLEVRLLLAKEEYTQAHAYLDKLMWSHPKSDEALVLLAQVYLVEGDRQKAENKFKAALELNPANIQAFLPIFNQLIAQKDTKYARELLQKALRKERKNVVLLQKLVQLNIQEEQWEEAQQVSVQLSKLAKGKNLAVFYQANILQGKGEYQKAIEVYKKLLVEFPQQQNILQNMSFCYQKLNKRSEMVKFLQESIKTNKDNVVANLLLADLYVADKKHTKAINVLNSLIKSRPNIAVIHHHLAKVYLAKKKVKKAISVYEQGLKTHQGDVRLSLALASLYEQQKKYTKAVSLYEQLIQDRPDFTIAVNNLATLLIDHFPTEDNTQRALQLVKAFVDIEQPYYQDTYAWAVLHNGDMQGSLKLFKALINKAPNVPIFRYHLAVAEYKNNNNSAASVQLSEAIQLAKKGRDFPERVLADQLQKEIINKMRNH